ncbi:hypothetical protein AMTR_s00039p00201100, partial [Amborella trichopoda]
CPSARRESYESHAPRAIRAMRDETGSWDYSFDNSLHPSGYAPRGPTLPRRPGGANPHYPAFSSNLEIPKESKAEFYFSADSEEIERIERAQSHGDINRILKAMGF